MPLKPKLLILATLLFLFFTSASASAATLKLSPSSGTFVVGSTFDVSIFLNTEGKSINVVDMALQFPPDKLQLVSPSAGKSIISVWTDQPSFNNKTGRVSLQGGIPNGGINVSQGLVTKMTFRVKKTGTAIVRFLDASQVLLNDGKGTDDLGQIQNGVYSLILPPPAGPIVASETHPDQALWYPSASAVLKWASDEKSEGYSYVLNKEPIDMPDNISEGLNTHALYKILSNGSHFFHIKSIRGGTWGGTTHYAISVDTNPPANFSIEINPSPRTSTDHPVVSFITTDALSGFDYYELKIIPLTPGPEKFEQSLFIEAISPFIMPKLDLGNYDVLIRAYDKAGNFREVTKRLQIVKPLFRFISDEGLEIRGIFILPWYLVWIMAALILGLLGFGAWRVEEWHLKIHHKAAHKNLPPELRNQLNSLKEYQKKYGKLTMLLLILLSSFFIGSSVLAQNTKTISIIAPIDPPLITAVPKVISNEDIFYLGCKTETPNIEVVIFLQNLKTGETTSFIVDSNNLGDWFYRHDTFLSSGLYRLWAQSRIGDQLSPPSPQVQLKIQPTAIQFGASRISYEALYLGIIILLVIVSSILACYIIFHARHGRRKYNRFMKEVGEVEEAVRHGFAVLKRDIEAEITAVRRAGRLTTEEKRREKELLDDLERIRKEIGKEILDIEKFGPHLE